MKRDVIALEPTTPVCDLREILRDNRISGCPVVENGVPIGMISVEDFIHWLAAGSPECCVEERMTRNIVSVYDDEPVVAAVNKLERFGFGRLPVVSRASKRLTGVITKGYIIAGMLRKLDVDYRRAEMRSGRSRHIFEDIVAERGSLNLEYTVGDDVGRAGASASDLKMTLQRLGFSPDLVRRVAIGVYEAEMNLIFYAGGGRISARIEPERIRIEVEDEGPGIPDVSKAIEPGFSTAPDWVREMGFGAGMGLHNITSCSDDMRLESTVDVGTRLVFDFRLEDGHGAS